MDLSTKPLRALEANDMQEISQVLLLAKEKLQPFVQELTNEQKGAMAKMSDGSYSFAMKAMERGAQYPMLVPAFVSVAEMKEQFAYLEQLRHLAAYIAELNKAADDSMLLANSRIYGASLQIYKQVKMGADYNVPGAKTIYEDLKVRFENQGKKPESETPQNPQDKLAG